MLETLWTYEANQSVDVLLVAGDDCLLTTRNTRLVSLNASSGEERWSARILNPWGALAATPSTVFYLNQHSLLVAHDRAGGRLLWSRELHGIEGWLHAHGETVVVGGWRGYTDILAMNADDGTSRWSRSAQKHRLHSTRVHGESSSLALADSGPPGSLAFLDLESGNEIARFPALEAWRDEYSEYPRGTTTLYVPLILEANQDSFLRVTGNPPTMERIYVPDKIWSRNLSEVGGVVPYLSDDRALVVWSVSGERPFIADRIDHNRRDLLPFAAMDDGSWLVGTSFGLVRRISPRPGEPAISRRVGKRVSTGLFHHQGVVVCGTDNGQVLGLAAAGIW